MAAKGEPVVLVREETSPEDIAGMHAAAGILTTRGGATSHAAVVARGMGKTCVVGAGEITVDHAARRGPRAEARSRRKATGSRSTARPGEVIARQARRRSPRRSCRSSSRGRSAPRIPPVYRAFTRILEWADARRRLGVRANADTPNDARVARLFGAEGIGLCRTEHMFFEAKRIAAVREMILAETLDQRRAALAKILPMQREDFVGIFREMGDRPVTIRLLDPPLHEFLPHDEETMQKTAHRARRLRSRRSASGRTR